MFIFIFYKQKYNNLSLYSIYCGGWYWYSIRIGCQIQVMTSLKLITTLANTNRLKIIHHLLKAKVQRRLDLSSLWIQSRPANSMFKFCFISLLDNYSFYHIHKVTYLNASQILRGEVIVRFSWVQWKLMLQARPWCGDQNFVIKK